MMTAVPAYAADDCHIESAYYYIEGANKRFVYNGKIQKPDESAIVIYDGRNKDSKNIIDSSEYNIEYDNSSSKNIGRYTGTVVFKDDAKPEITFYYTIVPKVVSFSSTLSGKNSIELMWKERSAEEKKEITGFEVTYDSCYEIWSRPKVKNINSESANYAKISKLKSGRSYYITIRAKKGDVYSKKYSKCVNTDASLKSMKSTADGKTYDIVKNGNVAYFALDDRIFLANTKANTSDCVLVYSDIDNPRQFAVKNGYLYFVGDDWKNSNIYRVAFKSGKVKKLATIKAYKTRYKIMGKKIYYSYAKNKYKTMSLNGSNKKNYKGTFKVSHSVSNVKGYSITYEEIYDGGYKAVYLMTPGNDIYIEEICVYDDCYDW